MQRSGSFLPPYLSTRTSSLYLSCLLLITAASFSVSAGFEISEVRLLVGLIDEGSISVIERNAHSLVRHSLSWVRISLVVLSATLFGVWLYRARINGRAFGARRFEYSRKWALLGFLIPVLNLVRPLQVVSEVWRVSDPCQIGNPFAWKVATVPRFVQLWWWLLVGCGGVTLIGLALTTTSGVTVVQLTVARGLSVIGDLGATVSAVLGSLIVISISRAQDRKWAMLSGTPAQSAATSRDDAFGDPAIAGMF